MKIINRQEFLKAPAGTVFMKFGPGIVGEGEGRGWFGELSIKAETHGADYRYFTLDPSLNIVGGDAAIYQADADPTIEVPIEITHSTRDDHVEDVDQKFAVWSRADLGELIRVLDKSPPQ